MHKTTLTSFFVAVSISTAFFLVQGCKPRQTSASEEDELPVSEQTDVIANTDSQPEKMKLQNELDTMLQDKYGNVEMPVKAQELFVRKVNEHPLLSIMDFGITTFDDMKAFFAVAPAKSEKDIIQQVSKQVRDEIREDNNLKTPEEIPQIVKAKHPVLPLKTKLRFKTLYGREVSGVLLARTRDYVKIGSKPIPRMDIPMELRVKLFEADRDDSLPELIRAEIAATRAVIDKNFPEKLGELLPLAFKNAGYIPNPLLSGASFKSTIPEQWVSRPALLEQLVALQKKEEDAYAEQFWKEKGYEKRQTAQGVTWVKRKTK